MRGPRQLERYLGAVRCAPALLEAAIVPRQLGSTRGGYQWWWLSDQFSKPAYVLCDGRERELVLRAARAAQPKATKPEDALEMVGLHSR
jgi:hypothetical protein